MTRTRPWSRTGGGSRRRSGSTPATCRSGCRSTRPTSRSTSRRRSRVRSPNRGRRWRRSTGTSSANAGLAPLVLTADCLPVALAGPGGVAMLHCGWRGLAAGIVARGAATSKRRAAAIGPGIGPCCYEVGPEVLEAFADLGEGIADGRMLDLPEVARRLLARAGVEQVESAGLCTFCEPELFFSHRRDAGAPAGWATSPGSNLRRDADQARSMPRTLFHDIDPARVRANLEEVGSRGGGPRRGARRLQVRAARGDGGARRGRGDAGRREPPAGPRRQARGATRPTSPGTSSATCRAARSSRSCRWCG